MSPHSRFPRAMAGALVLLAGFASGVFMHYGLHRLILTTEPFIYISF